MAGLTFVDSSVIETAKSTQNLLQVLKHWNELYVKHMQFVIHFITHAGCIAACVVYRSVMSVCLSVCLSVRLCVL